MARSDQPATSPESLRQAKQKSVAAAFGIDTQDPAPEADAGDETGTLEGPEAGNEDLQPDEQDVSGDESPDDAVDGAAPDQHLSEEDLDRLVRLPSGEEIPVRELSLGYQRNKHSTQLWQDLAESRRGLQGIRQTIDATTQAVMQPLMQELQQAEQYLRSVQDPEQFQRARMQYDRIQQYVQHVQGQAKQAQEQLTQQAQQLLQQQWSAVDTDMRYRTASWGDAYKRQLFDAGKQYGFTDQELQMFADSRLIQLLEDGKRWRDLQAKTRAKPGTRIPTAQAARQSAVDQQTARAREIQQIRREAMAGSKHAAEKLRKMAIQDQMQKKLKSG